MGAIYQQAYNYTLIEKENSFSNVYNTKIDQLIEPTSFTQSINQSRPVIRTHTLTQHIST